jgi:hypothetical protein
MILTFVVSAAEAAAETMMKMSDDKNSPTEPPLLIPFQELQQGRKQIMRTSICSNILNYYRRLSICQLGRMGQRLLASDAVATC